MPTPVPQSMLVLPFVLLALVLAGIATFLLTFFKREGYWDTAIMAELVKEDCALCPGDVVRLLSRDLSHQISEKQITAAFRTLEFAGMVKRVLPREAYYVAVTKRGRDAYRTLSPRTANEHRLPAGPN